MIKQGLRNYVLCLRYIFTPLGVLAFALVWGLSIALPAISGCLSELSGQLAAIAAELQLDFPALADAFEQEITTLDWENPTVVLETILSDEWLTHTLNDCLIAAEADAEAISRQFTPAILDAVSKIFSYVVLVAVFVFIGLFAGAILTKRLVRQTIAKRPSKRNPAILLMDALLSAILVFLLAYLVLSAKLGILVTVFLSCLLFCFLSLFEAYMMYARKKIPMKRIINPRNILCLMLSDILLLLITGMMIALLIILSNRFVGLLIGTTLGQITLLVVSMNAESDVLRMVSEEPPARIGSSAR